MHAPTDDSSPTPEIVNSGQEPVCHENSNFATSGGTEANHPSPDDLDEDVDVEFEPTPSNTKRPALARYGGYNELKQYNGQYYSGMAVGGSHTWNYDPGVWYETKEEPDLWKIDYKTHKRRDRKAPQGSGAPVSTEYHWLIVAHQVSEARVLGHAMPY
jgi:hypothetical protein